jgi:hypothetical protein
MRSTNISGGSQGAGSCSSQRGRGSLGLLEGGAGDIGRRRKRDSGSHGLSELIKSNLVVTIRVESSDYSNHLGIGGNEAIESEEGLNVSVVKSVISE